MRMPVILRTHDGWHLWHVNDFGTAWRREGPWWRVWPDVVAHKLDRRLPYSVRRAACRWRGQHGGSYVISWRRA
jgi:hypothetical protein